jgi:glycine oxidase
MHHPDICIAGAGIIGLSIALELHRRGARVTILDRTAPLAEASTAAAGMLAAQDPHTLLQLRPIADLSLSLYPLFLDHLQNLGGNHIAFQTHATLQALPSRTTTTKDVLTPADLSRLLPSLTPGDHSFVALDEQSLDPRQLAAALLAAVNAAAIDLRHNTPVLSVRQTGNAIEVHTTTGTLHTSQFINCTGAWASATSQASRLRIPVVPKKGQMLAVSLPSSLPLQFVVRTADVYIVPRTSGPNAGRAVIGATIEDAGFDKTLHSRDIDRLHTLAVALLPPLADAPRLETWAGLRPATSDGLPLIGALSDQPNHFIAAGHYRDGILLAPATAHLIGQLLCGEEPSIDLASLSPERFIPEST